MEKLSLALEPPIPLEDDQDKFKPEPDLQEEEEDLTFEEICPMWNNKINNWDQLEYAEQYYLRRVLRTDGSRCFLGEAWGWSNGWGKEQYDGSVCGMCKDFGEVDTNKSMVRPFLIFTGDVISDLPIVKEFIKTFEQRKTEFVDHWNKYHKKFRGIIK